jgi:hypothetical protein
MLIPLEVVLGLASTFYVLVAIRWFRETLAIRREGRRAYSAMVPLLTHAAKNATAFDAKNTQACPSAIPTARQRGDSNSVIVMGREKTRKQDKRVIA